MAHRLRPLRSLHVLPAMLLAAVVAWVACSDLDSHSLGAAFRPANTQVRQFTQPVYVEYAPGRARVWGPAMHLVEPTIDGGTDVTLRLLSDSVAIFTYGHPEADTTRRQQATLTIDNGTHPYALYLNGIELTALHGAALTSLGTGNCNLVLTQKSKNTLTADEGDGADIRGALVLTGTGALEVTARGHALHTVSDLRCQYGVVISLHSLEADGIHIDRAAMRSTQGKWSIDAARHAICSESDSIILAAGSYEGTAATGAFCQTPLFTAVRQATISMLSAQPTMLLAGDENPDSLYVVHLAKIDTLTFMADSTYVVTRNTKRQQLTTLTPRQTIDRPWLTLSSPQTRDNDTLYIR